MATRSFSDCIDDTEHNFARHPADYTLFKIGTFNDKTAEIEYLSPHINLGNGVEYKSEQLALIKEEDDNAKQSQL